MTWLFPFIVMSSLYISIPSINSLSVVSLNAKSFSKSKVSTVEDNK